MTQIQQLKILNDTTILYLKKLGKDYKRNQIIRKILKDDACFFKMEKEDACTILQDIGITEDEVELVYSNLISSNNYYTLQKTGKIRDDDKEILVKYNNYNYDDLFKKKEPVKIKDPHEFTMIIYKEPFYKRAFNWIRRIFKKY